MQTREFDPETDEPAVFLYGVNRAYTASDDDIAFATSVILCQMFLRAGIDEDDLEEVLDKYLDRGPIVTTSYNEEDHAIKVNITFADNPDEPVLD